MLLRRELCGASLFQLHKEIRLVQKKVFALIAIFCLCFVAFFTGNRISENSYHRKVDELSTTIESIKNNNKQLSDRNTELLDSNRKLQERVGGLQKEISRRDTEHSRQLEEIGRKFEEIATGLSESGETLQGIIDGIESIKIAVQDLPID